MTVGHVDHRFSRRYCAECVRHLAEGDDSSARPQQLFVLLENHLTAAVYRSDTQACALFCSELLPGNNVGVMLEPRDHNFVVFLDVAVPPTLGDQIDALGGTTHEDDLTCGGSIQKSANFVPRALISIGRTCSQRVGSPVNVGILVAIKSRDPVNDRIRLLGSRGVVEPNQRSPVHMFLQDREVAFDDMRIKKSLPEADVRNQLRLELERVELW